MSDWRSVIHESILLLADIGLTIFFYKLYRSKCTTADMIKDLEERELSAVKRVVKEMPDSVIPYGIVKGSVDSLDGSIKSQFTDAEGPVRYFKRSLLKSERHRGFWVDTSRTISETYDRVPFQLREKNGDSFIVISNPSSASHLKESLQTTHDHFEPQNRSVTGFIFERIVGEVTKGVNSTESLLKNGTSLLGVGKIVYSNGQLELHEPTTPHSSYILTSLSKDELVAHLKSKAFVFKLMTGIFGVAGIIILWVTVGGRVRRWLDENRSRRALQEVRDEIARIRESRPSANVETDITETPNNTACVICLSSAREIALRPCGHVCTCLDCFEAMPSPRLCPVCRGSIDDVLPVFIS